MLWFRSLLIAMCITLCLGEARCADLQQAQQWFHSGQYRRAMHVAQQEVDRGIWNERWSRLLVECQLTLGQYSQALQTYETAMKRYSSSIHLRFLGQQVYRFNNQSARAQQEFDAVLQIAERSPWRYSDKESLIALGRYFIQTGEDAKKVLELFYDRVLNTDPKYVPAHIAAAELALAKHDFALAAKQLDQAARLQPDDAEICFLGSLAWRSSDPARAGELLERTLQLNPHHIDALLWHAEQHIDAERFDLAESRLLQVLEINPFHPRAWALHAVIAHLQGHFHAERLLRKAALSRWEYNPEVDHLIGTKLSQHYRFVEGIAYQRRALVRRPDWVEAKFQLAQDLLRTGDWQAGWELADEVFKQDQYNVVALNLVNLHDRLKTFTTLEAPGFVIRMDAREARIFGNDVIALLSEARETLCKKYDVQLQEPTYVEIFPKQKDFAIRTFGLPGGDGFLGVCFGRLITANSPAALPGTPSNWKSVLWHEFTHVVTLQKTNNRMPRWLSEGISVYEELQRDPAWGQSIDPLYRQMLLDDDTCTPLSELSGAFLQTRSAAHLQFAYYESSLAVAYLIEELGIDGLKQILADLAIGMPMDETLRRHGGSLDVIDKRFKTYVHRLTDSYGKPEAWEISAGDESKPLSHFERTFQRAKAQRDAKDWKAAAASTSELEQMFEPTQVPLPVLKLQASVYRELGDIPGETAVLRRIAARSGDAVSAYQRLIELGTAAKDWESVLQQAGNWIDVNPHIIDAQEALADAAEHLKQAHVAATALQALTEMSPPDPAGLRFRLAQALADSDQPQAARRQVLMALEIAPKYRDALQLLLKLHDATGESPPQSD